MRWTVLVLALAAARISYAAAPEAPADWRYTLTVHEIARADDDERLQQLMQANPDRAGLRLPDGRTAAHVAAEAGSLKSLAVLAKAGADFNALDAKHRTPLSIAITANLPKTVKAILDQGANANQEAWSEITDTESPPVMIAAKEGRVEMLKVLVDAKADVNLRSADGSTALTVAANNTQWAAVNFLLDHGADVNTQDAKGTSALIAATAAGDVHEVATLLDHGANPKLTDKGGLAALSVTESPTLWKLLVDHGADVNVVVRGSTPLQYFIAEGKVKLVKVFLEYKPDPFIPDRKGQTAKELARHYASKSSTSYEADMARRQIAQMVEAYQKQYAAEQDARERELREKAAPAEPASRPTPRG